jgi:hypothetical protein
MECDRSCHMNTYNSYMVRIYRRNENDPRLLVGVVEEVGTEGKKAFSNLYELWDILNPTRKNSARASENRKVKQTQPERRDQS